jgi:hypothetical protein
MNISTWISDSEHILYLYTLYPCIYIRLSTTIYIKYPRFYSQELNRLRCAAISFGFGEVLTSVAQLLERECQLLPANSHPDAALQLTHAANMLRSTPYNSSVLHTITPLHTRFTAGE